MYCYFNNVVSTVNILSTWILVQQEVSGGYRGGKGGANAPPFNLAANLRLLYSSFGFVPIITFSLQR